MATRRSALLFVVSALVCLAFAPETHAQFNFLTALPDEASDVSIILSPENPGPDQTVQLSAQSSYFDLTQSSVTWYANGSEIAEGEGVTTASVTTGAIGSATDIEVDIQAPDGTVASASDTIIPASIDLLYDSDSYVPPFYQGRSMPSAGTNIRLQAIPHFEEQGSALAASSLKYTWQEDGRIVASASGIGRSTVILPTPQFDQSTTISVDAVSSDGTVEGVASVTIPIVKPILTLYEDDPLFGVLYNQALGSQTSFTQNEMTFQAAPYFAQAQSPDDPRLTWSWTVNNAAVAPDKSDPSEITINAQNSTGVAQIAAEVIEPSNIFMDSTGHWEVDLASTGQNGSGIFQSAGSSQPSLFGQ